MTDHARTLRIAARFRGPKDTGNGGYVCGLLGRRIDGPVEITLRRPPPLERSLNLVESEGGLDLFEGDSLIANAVAAPLHLEVPQPPPALEEARAAAVGYPGAQYHPFPGCFVCGTGRAEGEGLRIFPGPLPDRPELLAAPWECGEALADAEGLIRQEFICAALDCPGHWATAREDPERAAVLVRFHCEIERALPAGTTAVVAAWPLAQGARRAEAGTAVFDGNGRLVGRARAVWLAVDRSRLPAG